MVNILAADENPLIPPLGEIIIGIIAFSVGVLVLQRLAAPRFERVFRPRREAIEGGIERAEAMQAEAREALERYRAQLAEARTEAAQIRDQARPAAHPDPEGAGAPAPGGEAARPHP